MREKGWGEASGASLAHPSGPHRSPRSDGVFEFGLSERCARELAFQRWAGAPPRNVILEHYMSDRHDHAHVRHALAATPTLSLLRLSAWQRLAGAGLVLAVFG